MELHTLGVDGGYTQKDVTEVARCFTGWTIEKPREIATLQVRRKLHDPDPKIVLGKKIRRRRNEGWRAGHRSAVEKSQYRKIYFHQTGAALCFR